MSVVNQRIAARPPRGSESIIAEEDMTLDGGVLLAQGSQFSRPVNLDGYWNARSFFTLGLPADFLKSRREFEIRM